MRGTERRVLRQIGVRIRAAREAAGLTQEDAAHRAGIDYKRWQRLEAGQSTRRCGHSYEPPAPSR